MNTSRVVKLPNCSPFLINVDRLMKLYSEIKANGYLHLDCLATTDTARDSNTEHSVPVSINTTIPDFVTKRQPIRNSDDVRLKNIIKPLLAENVLKRNRDLYDFPENDQEDAKQVKIARTSNAPTVQRTTGNFNNVMASLISEQNSELEAHNSPKNNNNNKLTAQPENNAANNVRMDFEYEATSPTRITVNIQDTVNHIKDI